MPAISEITINAFRGISNLKISNLSTVNVLVGANNSGKTSVLEAIKLISDPYNFGKATNLAFLRAPAAKDKKAEKIVEATSTLYQKEIEDRQTNYLIDISALTSLGELAYASHGQIEEVYTSTGAKKKAFSVSVKTQLGHDKPIYQNLKLTNGQDELLSQSAQPLMGMLYVHAGVSYYYACVSILSESILNERKKDLLGLLKSFEPSVEDISIVGEDVYLHNSVSGTLPLYVYGTGLQKAVMLSGVLASMEDGVILIDEIDNAINISAFEEVFSWFVRRCKVRNIQAFLTTHSMEAIDAVLDTADPGSDDIRIITLRRLPNSHNTVARVRTGAEASADRSDFKMELRV